MVDAFRETDKDKCVYLFFQEDSTRTKESFRNAALFHGAKVNVFDAASSSLNKGETITDTIKMLVGYSVGQTVFVIRSPWEGVQKWLDISISRYCKEHKMPRPSFINAGDGKHEHPTQELLDEFTFLEQNNWNTDKIHI